jgi:hypothetical protein
MEPACPHIVTVNVAIIVPVFPSATVASPMHASGVAA